ncbi:hypothetical protein DUNSADRAFT_8553 [Dunaliella salina]|uniref:JmjC domain-containing protein n=1 Tax=Dunaliella salina TaxID=3046 RepID=A0ABQ7GJ90_DUNSA|nr:hypothetical protein DUNSADRAFT_8553 [Dunaliella salina]|eukprot:KAF5834671.1 hypothetical protein DUNSADRAFT_8553 [Dunaliella salina]
MPSHPLGILPEGHILLDGNGGMGVRNSGLGNLHCLSDALILEVCGHLDARTLASLSQASKACYCFCATEDLWKAHVLEDFEGDFTWDVAKRTWRAAYAASKAAATLKSGPAAGEPSKGDRKRGHSSIGEHQHQGQSKRRNRKDAHDQGDKGKDQLIQGSAQAGHVGHEEGVCGARECRDRESKTGGERGGRKGRMGNGVKAGWEEVSGGGGVCVQGFYSDLLYQPWHCATAGVQPEWLEVSNVDRYLFDKDFVAKAPQLAEDFSVPSVFNEDLFGVLGDSRPDYRWLIVGPARSGSSFHVDPNCTSAWNAVVKGSKKWIMFPPGAIPPGVHPSPDGADVATPVSVMEWFLNFYAAAREAKVPPLECVVGKGEVIFVPRGWWHACLNLETMTIAVTQNYVSSANVVDVLRFIRPGRRDLISGCAPDERDRLHGRFLLALKEHRPDVVHMVEEKEQAKQARRAQEAKLSSLFTSAKPASSRDVKLGGEEPALAAQHSKPSIAGGFSFNFSLGS